MIVPSVVELRLREELRQYIHDAADLTEAARVAAERLYKEDLIRTPDERRMWKTLDFNEVVFNPMFGKTLEVDGIISRTTY